ncbi:MAG TPA: hypothetical protein VGQ11_04835 [Candidatus Acidoferrales bacterium]|jgi:hypothetical protein|nr:hypothetical protein [Candidatus Acidoferrales bacterium]
MRRTRFMSVLFLMLSAAFFFVPQFRQAFSLPFVMQTYASGRVSRLATIPVADLQLWARDAESQRDARTLAFAALHLPDPKERTRLADLAVSLDPKLGWIYFSIISRAGDRKSSQTLGWAKKLQQFDPENALGFLQEAEHLRENSPMLAASSAPGMPNWDEWLKQTEWSAAMAKAFASPHYDSYALRRFDLERAFMRQHGIATPARMLFSLMSYPIPNLLNIRQYAVMRVNKLGKDAEKAGQTQEALNQYWAVAHFGERMQLGAFSLIEQLIAVAVQKIAYQPLESLLRGSGQAAAADTVNYATAEMMRRVDALRGKDVLAVSSNYVWNALMVNLFLGLVVIFGAMTVISVLYVNAKRWLRKDKQGKTYATVTIAENYLPVLLFCCCVGLYIGYYPYARNFHYYMTVTGEMHDMESFFVHTISIPDAIPGYQLPLGNPFVPYVWYALVGFLLALAVTLIGSRQEATPEPPKAQAAGV